MNSEDPTSSDDQLSSKDQTSAETEAASAVGATSSPPTSAPAGRSELALRPALAVVAGLLGAVAACVVLSATLPAFKLSGELLVIASNESPPPEDAARLSAAEFAIARNNAMLAMATAGLFLGGLLGIAEGVARRSMAAAMLMGGWALVVGAIFGGLAGMLGHLVYHNVGPMKIDPALVRTIAWQAAMAATLGLGIALALTLPLRNPSAILNGVLGGVLGGVLAAILVPPLAAFVMIDADTEALIPTQAKLQFIWLGVTAVLLAAGTTGLGKRKAKQS